MIINRIEDNQKKMFSLAKCFYKLRSFKINVQCLIIIINSVEQQEAKIVLLLGEVTVDIYREI